MTPEGRVKKMVSNYLTDLRDRLEENGCYLHWSMFVPTGYGKRNTLDYTICFAGLFVAIETKAPGEDLTPQQRITCRDIYKAGGTVFIISGVEGLRCFMDWVHRNEHRYT